MRSVVTCILAIAAAACGEIEPGGQSVERAAEETVVYINMERPERFVKHFPYEPDPANDALDPTSCSAAGGEWDDYYFYGVLILREPKDGAESAGQRCWSRRQPQVLPDAGKPCSGQSDCIGNCTAEDLGNGLWSGPKCQTYAGTVCGPIYEAGLYHWIQCPIP